MQRHILNIGMTVLSVGGSTVAPAAARASPDT